MSNFSGKNYTKTHDENSNNENQDQIKENIPLNKSSNKKISIYEENKKYCIAYRNSIEYDMSFRKMELKMKKEDKEEMEKIRRFNVKIHNIFITSLIEVINPFLQFTIGGDYMVNIYQNSKGDYYKKQLGSRGFTEKTEVLHKVSPNQESHENQKLGFMHFGKTPFEKVIDFEIRMSYSMINHQNIMVELWDSHQIWTNEIQCYFTIPLIEIINGNCNVSQFMHKKIEETKPFAFIEFICEFEEIWDFNMNFTDFKGSSLIIDNKKNYNINKIEIELSKGKINHRKSISTNNSNNQYPLWNKFDNSILYRGTQTQLENEEITISIYNNYSPIFNNLLAKKVIPLDNIVNDPIIKVDFHFGKKNMNLLTVCGNIIFDKIPKYQQVGKKMHLFSFHKYLIFNILKIENIKPQGNNGIINSYLSLDWNGNSLKTKLIKENSNPIYNEKLYYKFPIPDDVINGNTKSIELFKNELKTKNEIKIRLMVEDIDSTFDANGIGYFYLNQFTKSNASLKKEEESFYADDLKKEKHYICNKYIGKIKLISPFSNSSQATYLYFESWFTESVPLDKLTFPEEEKNYKLPFSLQKYFKKDKSEILEQTFNSNIMEWGKKFPNFQIKNRNFFSVRKKDQYANDHYLSSYLSPITLNEKKYLPEEKEKFLFFNSNLHSLSEIAHFVRCIPFQKELNEEIWSSPDFLIKTKKGNTSEHSIIMACLMMGLREQSINKKDLISKKEIKINSKESTSESNSSSPQKFNQSNFPFERRIFVCIGTLKESLEPHTWVMAISSDCKDITFYDPKIVSNKTLKNRVQEPKKLQSFLDGYYETYSSIEEDRKRETKIIKGEIMGLKEKREKIEKLNLKGEKENSFALYNNEDDFKDSFKNETMSIMNNTYNQQDIQRKIINDKMIDDKIAFNNQSHNQTINSNFEYLGNNSNLSYENEQNCILPVEYFRDEQGNTLPDVYLPYESIDLIFNQNNIFANLQDSSPNKIYYNLYNRNQWLPFFCYPQDTNKIFNEKFDNFYYQDVKIETIENNNIITKMISNLQRDIRISIATSRKENNLSTKFKNKNEKIVTLLSQYLDYIEEIALGRIELSYFEKEIKPNWMSLIKKQLPPFYHMQVINLFFNYYESELIRRNIHEELENFWNDKQKYIIFATSGKIYPYQNHIISTRIIIAKFYKIPLEDISNPLEQKLYYKYSNEKNVLTEESDSESQDEDNHIN